MNICYELSMPGRVSWNGRWSGEGKIYAIVERITGKKRIEKYRKIIADGPYNYRWTDGWCACVRVHELDVSQARRIRKASQGFCGYDWMVTSIKHYGEILADHEKPAAKYVVAA